MKYCVILKDFYSWKGFFRVDIDWNNSQNEDTASCVYALNQLSVVSYTLQPMVRLSNEVQKCIII